LDFIGAIQIVLLLLLLLLLLLRDDLVMPEFVIASFQSLT